MIASFFGAESEMACQNRFSWVLRGDGLLPPAGTKPVRLVSQGTPLAYAYTNFCDLLRVSSTVRDVEKRNFRR